MVKGLKTIIVLLVITASFNLFFTRGDNALVDYGIIHISDTGITNALTMIVRLVLLIIGTSLMTLTTTPNQLTDGLEKSMGPLNKIHVPVHAISMMMSIALRFIPILIEETDKIMKAQMARGADFENGNILRRAKIWFRSLFRFLFLLSAEPMTLLWRWRQDAIMAVREEQR